MIGRRLTVAVATLAAVFSMVLADSSQGAITSWTLLPAVEPPGGGAFAGVSCATPTLCMAVGAYELSSAHRLLAEELTSSGWKLTPTATPSDVVSREFDAIACSANLVCTAVGNFGAEAWNGSSWRVALQGLTSEMFLVGISCAAEPTCLAVGHEVQPRPGLPNDVRTFAETRTGLVWNRPYPPNPSPSGEYSTLDDRLASVSCISVTSCMSVGFDTNGSLAEALSASTWSVLATPAPPSPFKSYGLRGVSCVQASCMAVGAKHVSSSVVVPLIDRWDGTKWLTLTSASLPSGDNAVLTSVSCVDARFCMTAGSDSLGPIVESWNGGSWSLQRLPTPALATAATLLGVSCTTRWSCVAVGSYKMVSGKYSPLAERFNGLSA